MELKKRIEDDLKKAMKAKNAAAVSALRMVISAIQNKEIEERTQGRLKLGEELKDEGILKVLAAIVKQRQESIEMFKKGSREDLVKKETAELEIINNYLPKQMSDEEIQKIVLDAVSKSGACGMKDLGPVMKIIMPKLAGRADGKRVNEIVRQCLTPQS